MPLDSLRLLEADLLADRLGKSLQDGPDLGKRTLDAGEAFIHASEPFICSGHLSEQTCLGINKEHHRFLESPVTVSSGQCTASETHHDRVGPRGAWLAMVVCPLLLAAQSPKPGAKPIARLQSSIERITRGVNATWGVYIKSIETGEEIAIGADRQMDTMSVIKIPLMVEVLEQIKAGKMTLSDKYTLSAGDILPGTGILRSLDPGAVLTVKDLITLMIIVSDNTATDVLYRMAGGPEAVNRRMAALGMKMTRAPAPSRSWFEALRSAPGAEQFHREAKHPFGLSTPREIGMLLESMERGTLVNKASSQLMLQILRGQLYRTRIPRFLAGFRIPHKTGDFLPYIANDVGVLEADGTTVIVSIFTANHFGPGEHLEEAIGRIAEQAGAYFTYCR